MWGFSRDFCDDCVMLDEDNFTATQTKPDVGTVGANCCSSHGRHFFEVKVEKNRGGVLIGVQRLGGKCPEIGGRGVGIEPDSWAVDALGKAGTAGSWKSFAAWKLKPGMTVGCLIEHHLSSTQISFFKDGVAFGAAFTDLPPGYYRPALSLQHGQTCGL